MAEGVRSPGTLPSANIVAGGIRTVFFMIVSLFLCGSGFMTLVSTVIYQYDMVVVLEGVPGGGLKGRYEKSYTFNTEKKELAPGSVLAVEAQNETRTGSSSSSSRRSFSTGSRYEVSVLVVRTHDGEIRLEHPDAAQAARDATALLKKGEGPPVRVERKRGAVPFVVGGGLILLGLVGGFVALRHYRKLASPGVGGVPK